MSIHTPITVQNPQWVMLQTEAHNAHPVLGILMGIVDICTLCAPEWIYLVHQILSKTPPKHN
jgi:hypothetical protein